jgi:hypothetical protein
MEPLERTQADMIQHMSKLILEQNRRLQEANQKISDLKRELEISDEFANFQMNQLIENFEETITNILTPSMN